MKIIFSLFSFLITYTILNISCQNPLDPDDSKTVDRINFHLSLDKKEYELPDTLKIKFTITNFSGASKTFHFSSSCHLGFRIMLSDDSVIQYPEACLAVLTSLTISSGTSKEINIDYLLERFRGLIPGTEYKIEAFLLDNNSPVLSTVIKLH